jgi:hypothetical protein
MYKHERNEDEETWEWLMNNTPHSRDGDPCDTCYDEDPNCDYCTREYIEVNNNGAVRGLINGNYACWADADKMWREIYDEFGVHPDRLIARLHRGDLWNTYSYAIDPIDLKIFVRNCKAGAILPKYIPTPSIKNLEGNHWIVKLKLNNLSMDRMFFYLCVLRNPCEQPGVVKLMNHFCEYEIDPVLSYVLAHVCLPGFGGGHSALDVYNYRESQSNGNIEVPNVPKCIDYAVRVHKFLTKKTIPAVVTLSKREGVIRSWDLSRNLEDRVKTTDFKSSRDLTSKHLTKFSIRERKLKEVA